MNCDHPDPVCGRGRASAAVASTAGIAPTRAVGIPARRQVPDGVGIEELVAALRSLDPRVVAVVLAAALLLAVVAWYWRRRTAGGRFLRVLSRAESVSVVAHPNPDPDAMASAMAVAHLADHVGTTASIQYAGQIQHQENRAFEAVLNLDLERIESTEALDGDAVVLVDHNEPRGFAGAGTVTPDAVVDHHPGGGTGSAFTDVRTDYGACATILSEYLAELGAEVLEGDEDAGDGLVVPTDLATGLVYGIQSDTSHLTSGVSTAEFQACQFLYPGVDEETIDRLGNPQVEAEVLDVKARAIRNRRVEPPYAISDVQTVNNVDAIPQSADELITLEAVSTVVVYGRRDGTIHLSARSRDDRIHVGKALEAAVDGIPLASAGGHARMAGGQVSVEHMEGIGPATGVGIEEFEQRLLDALRGER